MGTKQASSSLFFLHFTSALTKPFIIMKTFLFAFTLVTLAFVATAHLDEIDDDEVDEEYGLNEIGEREILAMRGIMSMIPGGERFVEEVKEIGRQHKAVFLNPKLSWKEKVKEMMKIAKATLPKGLLAFGRFGLKVAVEKGLPLVIAAIGK